MSSSASNRQEFLPLLSSVYLGALVLLLLGALVWWFWPASSSRHDISNSIIAEAPGSYDSPTVFESKASIRQILLDQMTPEQSATRTILTQLEDLQRYIRNQVTGKDAVRPNWIGKSFVGVGVDPENYVNKQDDSVTSVLRYIQSESAPQFSGNRAFQRFIANTLAPVFACEDFRINIRLNKLQTNGEQFTATLLAESVGSRKQRKEEWERSGFLKKVVQVSSIWKTTWNLKGAKQFQLLKVEIPAAEVVKLSLNTPSLFLDYTDSILTKNNCLREQLIFGVDQWATKLPGIDTQGNLGLSIGDVNNDGRDDIYLCQPQGVPNLLLIQKRDGTAVDESAKNGVNLLDESRSSLLVDLDNDGDQDLVVATKSSLVLMSNFEDDGYKIVEKIDRCCDGLSLSAADYDNDGDIDLFLCRQPTPRASASVANSVVNVLAGSVLLRNDDSFRFVDATMSAGLVSDNPLTARSAIWFDKDLDGDQDLYVTAGKSGGTLFINHDGTFKRASKLIAGNLPNQQSVSSGDFNADGRFDLLVATTAEGGTKKANESHVSFGGLPDTTKPFFLKSPLFDNQHATTSLVADLNNDGRDDLVIGNGGLTRVALEDLATLFPPPIDSALEANEAMVQNNQVDSYFDAVKTEHYSIHSRQRNRVYASIGSNGFAEASSASGLDLPADSRAIAATDWDRDGDTDVLVMSRTGPQLQIFINQLNTLGRRRSVSFRLTGQVSNRDAIGARVELKLKGIAAPLVKTVQAGSGFLSQSSKRLTFGVGDAKEVESAVVHWPSGKVHRLKRITIGSMYELAEGNAVAVKEASNRYQVKIRGSRLSGSFRQPLSDQRTLVKPPFPLPPPEAQVASGKWNRLESVGNKPTILLFWGQNAQSEQALEQLNLLAGELENANANVITVFTDSADLQPDEQWKYLQNFANNLPGIKNWAALSNSGLATMEIAYAHWFGKRELPENPFGLLIDNRQRVIGIYPTDSLKKAQLLEDLKLCDPDLELAKKNSGENGFWANPVLSIDSRRLANRLNKAGFPELSRKLTANISVEIADDLTIEAEDFAAMGRYDLAQQYFNAALEKDPNNMAALLSRSNFVIEQALAASVTDSDQTFMQNNILAVSDSGLMLPEAESGFRQVLELDPKQWRATIGIAKIQLLQDHPSKALATLKQYQKSNPHVELLAMEGRVLFQSGDYDEALRVLGRAYDERPNLPYLAGDLGYLYLLNNDPRYARKLLREAHQLHPSDLTFMRMLAEAEFATDKFERAMALFTKVNQLQPNQLRSKNVLAWLLATCPNASQRDGVAALALIDVDSETLVDQPASKLEIYAACYAEVGEFDKAIQFQQQAVEKTNYGSAAENYSKQQLKGMLTRLELYRTKQPYRTRIANTHRTPIQINQNQLIDGKFKALRF